MKGHSHALSGAAGWIALTSPSAAAIGAYPQSLGVVAAGAVLCAGAALLPDIDHHSGTIAYSLPPLTKEVAKGVEHISGGHRHATHSWIGVAVFGVLAWLSTLWTPTVYGRTVAAGAGISAVILVAFAAKALRLTHDMPIHFLRTGPGAWVLALSCAGAATWFLDYRWSWLVPCVCLGAFLHNLGDSLTVEGVPWLWPVNPKPPKAIRKATKWFWGSNGYFRMPILGHTESWREGVFATLLGCYVGYEMIYLLGQVSHTVIPVVI